MTEKQMATWRKARNLLTGTIVEMVDGRVGMLTKDTGDPNTYWVKTSNDHAVCIKPSDRVVIVATTLDLAVDWLDRYNHASEAEKEVMVQHGKEPKPF
jgi:hypothetical protein